MNYDQHPVTRKEFEKHRIADGSSGILLTFTVAFIFLVLISWIDARLTQIEQEHQLPKVPLKLDFWNYPETPQHELRPISGT